MSPERKLNEGESFTIRSWAAEHSHGNMDQIVGRSPGESEEKQRGVSIFIFRKGPMVVFHGNNLNAFPLLACSATELKKLYKAGIIRPPESKRRKQTS